jgi:hypothetical protein
MSDPIRRWSASPAARSGTRRAIQHENRRTSRVPIVLEVFLLLESGESVRGTTRDISLGGIFVETKAKIPFGSLVTVSIPLRARAVDLRIDGSVRWTNPDGVGVQFGLMGARATYELTCILETARGNEARVESRRGR